MPTQPEPYLTAKELANALEEHHLRISVPYARDIIRDCPQSVRRQIRLADALAFLRENKDFAPRRRSGANGKAGLVTL